MLPAISGKEKCNKAFRGVSVTSSDFILFSAKILQLPGAMQALKELPQ